MQIYVKHSIKAGCIGYINKKLLQLLLEKIDYLNIRTSMML